MDPTIEQQNAQVQQNVNAAPPPPVTPPDMSGGQPQMPNVGTASPPNVVPHTTMMGQVARALLGHTTSYSVDANGNTVATEAPQKPGSFFKNVIAAAILGGAAADDAHTKNPQAGFMSGLVRGAGAEVGDQRAQDLMKQKQARAEFEQHNQANEEQRRQQGFGTEEQLRKAQIAEANQQTLRINQLMQGENFDQHVKEADRGRVQLKPYEDAGLKPAARDIPESEWTQFVKDHPGATSWDWAHTGVKVGHDADGKPTYEATLSAYNPTEGVTVTPELISQFKKDGLFVRHPEYEDVLKPGKKLDVSAYIAVKRADDLVYADKVTRDKNDLESEGVKARIAAEKASAAASYASAARSQAETGQINLGKTQQQAFNKALERLNQAGGDVMKLDPSDRILIGESGNKILGNLTDAYRTAVQNGDTETAHSLLSQMQSISSLTTSAMTAAKNETNTDDSRINAAVESLRGKSPEEIDAALSDPRIPDSAKSAIRKALGLPDAPARKSPDNQMLTSDGVEAPAL
ncbi:MAG: hypothetical protein JSS87_15185 [Acidobacteria bacterium]|nr:hypothetical protein [Acidobacteriota bacterium]